MKQKVNKKTGGTNRAKKEPDQPDPLDSQRELLLMKDDFSGPPSSGGDVR